MIATVADLRARGLADDRLTRLLRAGGWYLVGSRAAGFDDGFSDWDTVVLSSAEVSDENMLTDLADEIFDIERPRVVVPPTLDVHRRWRSAGAVVSKCSAQRHADAGNSKHPPSGRSIYSMPFRCLPSVRTPSDTEPVPSNGSNGLGQSWQQIPMQRSDGIETTR